MPDFCRSMVFLPLPILAYRALCVCIPFDYTVLSAAGAYAETNTDQEKIPCGSHYSADHTDHDGNFVDDFYIGLEAVGGITRILHADK